MQQLLEIMQHLRDPEKGCPWDVEQDFSSIAPFTIEEAYEVADAIERGEMTDLECLKKDCVECRRCSIGGVKVRGKFLSNVFSNTFS